MNRQFVDARNGLRKYIVASARVPYFPYMGAESVFTSVRQARHIPNKYLWGKQVVLILLNYLISIKLPEASSYQKLQALLRSSKCHGRENQRLVKLRFSSMFWVKRKVDVDCNQRLIRIRYSSKFRVTRKVGIDCNQWLVRIRYSIVLWITGEVGIDSN